MFACFLCLQVVSSYSSVSPTHCGMLQYIFLDSACLEPSKGLFPEAYHFPGPVLFWFQSMPFTSMLTHHQLLHRSNATYIHDPLLVAEIVEVLFAYDSAVDLPNQYNFNTHFILVLSLDIQLVVYLLTWNILVMSSIPSSGIFDPLLQDYLAYHG